MSLIACGSIHEGHEWFSDFFRGRQEIFMCNFADSRTPRGAKITIKSVLLHEIIIFVSVYSAAVKC